MPALSLQRDTNFSRSSHYLRRLIQPKVFIFAIALLCVIVAHISVARWYRQFGDSPGDFYPNNWVNVPYVLLFAATIVTYFALVELHPRHHCKSLGHVFAW